MKLWLLFIFIFFISPFANAADEKGKFAVRNAGMVSCKVFTTESERQKKSKTYAMYVGWIDGYISAANQFTNNTFDLVPWGNTPFYALLIAKHCEKFPNELFYVAVNKFIGSQVKTRLTKESFFITLKSGKNVTQVYKDVLKVVQQILKTEKYYVGAIDGAYGPGTKAAFEKYQKANKLAVTGLPDQLTLYRLYTKMMK